MNVTIEINIRQQKENRNRPFKKGDRVTVTNWYKSRQGVTGIVVRLKSIQAVMQLENGEEEFRKYKVNLCRI